jgi:hypothetical protein
MQAHKPLLFLVKAAHTYGKVEIGSALAKVIRSTGQANKRKRERKFLTIGALQPLAERKQRGRNKEM